LELYVSSNILFSLIKDKCSAILIQKKLIRFPIVFSLDNNKINLLIKYSKDSSLKNQIINSVTQRFISSVPIPHLNINVIDLENQSDNLPILKEFSITLPDLFNGGINNSNTDVEKTLEKLTVYLKDNPQIDLKKNPDIKLLIILDSPESLGSKNIALINNIIENGSSRGVYTIISLNTAINRQQENILPPYHEKYCIIIQQAVDMFLYYNLKVTYSESYTANELTKYVKNYMLLYYSLNGNITLLDSLIWKLITNDEQKIIRNIIDSIKCNIKNYNDSLGHISSSGNSFPSAIQVGTLLYPVKLIGDDKKINIIKKELSIANAEVFNIPATFDLNVKSNLLLSCPETIQQYTIKFIHNIIWSFISSLPVSKVNFCIFDAERRGNSIAPFLDFRQKLPEIFDEHIYTTQDAIMSRLQRANKYIDEFIQEKLGNRFDNIIEYNKNTPNRTEPITLLIIFDFPRNFDNRSIELLINILGNGSKCGIYTIICNNPNINFSKYENIDEHLIEIKKHCSLVEYIDKNFILQPYGLLIDIAPELSKEKIDNFINEYLQANTSLKQKGLSFEDILSKQFFTAWMNSMFCSMTLPIEK
jgi:hypothetical protein